VLLTDDPATLGWAISLPDDIGAVTRLAATPSSGDEPRADGPLIPQAGSLR
jgi:hypothetical protein